MSYPTRSFALRCAVLLFLAALTYTPDAFAGVAVKPSGVYYARPHHWYTNDGRHVRNDGAIHDPVAADRALLDNPALADALHVLEDHRPHHHKMSHECRHLRSEYVLRHGMSTPSGLHGQTGCRKWRNDAQFHEHHGDAAALAIPSLLGAA